MPHSLQTERLLLRPVTLRDAKPFWRALNDPYYTSMTGTWAYPFTPETVMERIRTGQRAGTVMHYWFSIIEGEELIGSGLFFGGDETSMEIGYAVARSCAGRGLAPEAARAMCGFAFRTLKLKAVTARVSVENPASIRLLEKLGFERQPGIGMGWTEHHRRETPFYNYTLIGERFRP